MEIIHTEKLELIYAIYPSSKERTQGKQEMINTGWIVYNEYLDNERNRIVAVYARHLPDERVE